MTAEIVPYAAEKLEDRMNYARTLAGAADLIPTGLHDPVYREGPNNTQVRVSGQTAGPNPGKVFLVMEYGAMLGLHPIAALSNIYVIEGKPSMGAALMAGVLRGYGHTIRVETEGDWSGDDFKATATLIRKDDPEHPFISVWTKARAAAAGLLTKDNWKHYGPNMAVARATSEVARQGGSDVLMGIHYTPEELDAPVTANGELVVTQEETEPAAPSALPPATKRATRGTQGTRRRKGDEQAEEPVVEPPTAEQVAEVVEGIAEPQASEEPAPEEESAAPQAPTSHPEVDRSDEAAVKAHNAAQTGPRKDLLTSDAERERQAERLAGFTVTSVVETTGEDLTGIDPERAEREAIAAQQMAQVEAAEAEEPAPVDPPIPGADEPVLTLEEIHARVAATHSVEYLRAIWQYAGPRELLTTAVRGAISARKAELEA